MNPVTWAEKIEARGKAKGMRELLRASSVAASRISPAGRSSGPQSSEELGSLAERLLTARSIVELELA